MFIPKEEDIISKDIAYKRKCPHCSFRLRKCNYELNHWIKYRCQNNNCLKQYFEFKNK